jgi:hypothetical protein
MEADSDDTRSLGVAISRLWLDGRAVGPDDARLSGGWHPIETDWRWTDGDASLAPCGARELDFEVVLTGSYWQEDTRGEVRVA